MAIQYASALFLKGKIKDLQFRCKQLFSRQSTNCQKHYIAIHSIRVNIQKTSVLEVLPPA